MFGERTMSTKEQNGRNNNINKLKTMITAGVLSQDELPNMNKPRGCQPT
jgi:hypothetical protein